MYSFHSPAAVIPSKENLEAPWGKLPRHIHKWKKQVTEQYIQYGPICAKNTHMLN